MMKTMLAEKAAAQASASAKTVKAEPSSEAPGPPPFCGNKKRCLEEARGEESPPTPPSALLYTTADSGVYSSAEGGGRGLSSPLASSRHLFLFPQKGGGPGASLLGSTFTFFADADACAAAFSASIVFIMR